jgi:hypothetical protein
VVLSSCVSSYKAPTYETTLRSIVVSPETAEVVTGTSESEELRLQFEALGTYSNGTEYTLDVVEWSLSNHSVGSIDDRGVFTPSQSNGGKTWVTARLANIEGYAEALVIFEQTINDEGIDPAAFEGPASELLNAWLYPEDGVNVPRNTPSLEFQWADLGAEAYRLRVRSPITDTSVYTTANSWKASEEWPVMAGTNAGGTLDLELSAVIDGELWTTPARSIKVNRMDAFGSIYYWTSSTAGFMRLPYGSSEPELYLDQGSDGECVGCHAISSTGMMAFTYGTSRSPLGLFDITSDQSVLGLEGTAEGRFKTFSPDGAWLLVVKDATLFLYDGVTGDPVDTVELPVLATHPDWSPDGTQVALTLVRSQNHDTEISGGRIALLEHLGDGVFGAYRMLVQPEDPYQAYYPTFSPDGAWVAFNQSTGDSYDDPDAELWIVSAEGGDAIRLDAANQGADLTNSWPHWAPLPDDDVLWLAFSSRRPYGLQVDGEPQVWISAFDPERAFDGQDPSWPAFWLPGQSTEHNNHLPVWVDDE